MEINTPRQTGMVPVMAFKNFTVEGDLYVRVWDDNEPGGWFWYQIASGRGPMREFMAQLEPAENYLLRFTVEVFGRPHTVETTFRT